MEHFSAKYNTLFCAEDRQWRQLYGSIRHRHLNTRSFWLIDAQPSSLLWVSFSGVTNNFYLMAIDKHDLLHEFPEHKETIHTLKTTNTHFARLFKEYHSVDKEVHRIENNVETPSDHYTNERKSDRLTLKDELYQMILTAV